MKRRAITSDEAKPATRQHKKPCVDCPWARRALRGWLGKMPADGWVQAAHGETYIECHVHTGVQCAGAAIYRANVCKLPRHPEALRLPADRVLVFASPTEFLTHHAQSERA